MLLVETPNAAPAVTAAGAASNEPAHGICDECLELLPPPGAVAVLVGPRSE